MKTRYFYKKILKYFLLISIVPILLLGIVTTVSIQKVLENRLISEAQKTNVKYLSSIEKTLDSYVTSLETLHDSEIVSDYLTSSDSGSVTKKFYEKAYSVVSALYEDIANITNANNSYLSPNAITNIHLINAQTNEILSLYDTPGVYELPKNSNWGIYRRTKEASDTVVYFNNYLDCSNIKMAGTAMKAFYDQEKLLGYVALDIPMEVLKNLTNTTQDMLPIHFSLVTDQNYILWNDNSLSSTANFISDMNIPKSSGYEIQTKENSPHLLTYDYSPKYHLYIIGGFHMGLLLGNLKIIAYIWAVVVFIITIFCILTTIKVTRTITVPLEALTSSIREVDLGNFDVTVNIQSNDEFGYVAKQFNRMCQKIKELFETNQKKQELLRTAELKQLQAQINPHFLYNTLDSIKYLAKMGGNEEVFLMTKSLNSLLKNSFRISKEFTTLSDSLKNLSSYVTIQKIRFSDKFQTDIEVEPDLLDCVIPNLILQPVVENAILHGLEPLTADGKLILRAYRQADDLFITITDNGTGMSEETCEALTATLSEPDGTSHIGLKNVHQRLQIYYGSDYGISVKSVPQSGTTVNLKLPYRKGDSQP